MDDDDVVDEARRAEEEEEEDRARAATRASRASRIVRARELFGALGGLACAMQCISVLPRVRCDELTHPQFQKLIATRSPIEHGPIRFVSHCTATPPLIFNH